MKKLKAQLKNYFQRKQIINQAEMKLLNSAKILEKKILLCKKLTPEILRNEVKDTFWQEKIAGKIYNIGKQSSDLAPKPCIKELTEYNFHN